VGVFALSWRVRCGSRLRRAELPRLDLSCTHVSCARPDLLEATALADAITLADARLAAHLELDELLDHYVDVAIARERCRAVLESVTPAQLARKKPDRRGIFERRIALWNRCRDRAEALDDELAGLIELLRLAVDQTTLGDQDALLDGTNLVADRLALLDDAHAAVAALEAG
jgi:hypothetical protein